LKILLFEHLNLFRVSDFDPSALLRTWFRICFHLAFSALDTIFPSVFVVGQNPNMSA
jgi:hypothetical protein